MKIEFDMLKEWYRNLTREAFKNTDSKFENNNSVKLRNKLRRDE